MGQEAGLAGVAVVGLESCESPDSLALQCWAQQEELGIYGSHFSLPALNLGHGFEGRLLSLLNPYTPTLLPHSSGNLAGPA